MSLKAALTTFRRRINDEIRKFSLRERVLCAMAAIVVTALFVSQSFKFVRERFDTQATEVETVQRSIEDVTAGLSRFSLLTARKAEIEAQYKQVEMSEGVRSFLENMLRTKAEVSSGYTIKDLPTTAFGGNYELAPFSIRFSTTSLQGVINFLNEIVHGPRPLILTDIELRKSRQGDKLDVSLGINSIRKSKDKDSESTS